MTDEQAALIAAAIVDAGERIAAAVVVSRGMQYVPATAESLADSLRALVAVMLDVVPAARILEGVKP